MSIKIPPEKKAWFDAQRAELRELLAKEKRPVACVTPTAVYFSVEPDSPALSGYFSLKRKLRPSKNLPKLPTLGLAVLRWKVMP